MRKLFIIVVLVFSAPTVYLFGTQAWHQNQNRKADLAAQPILEKMKAALYGVTSDYSDKSRAEIIQFHIQKTEQLAAELQTLDAPKLSSLRNLAVKFVKARHSQLEAYYDEGDFSPGSLETSTRKDKEMGEAWQDFCAYLDNPSDPLITETMRRISVIEKSERRSGGRLMWTGEQLLTGEIQTPNMPISPTLKMLYYGKQSCQQRRERENSQARGSW